MDDMNYATFSTGEGVGGGFNPVDENYPAGSVVPYVAVDDVDSALAEAESLGGKTLAPKMEVPGVGDIAIFADPSGNMIGLIKGEEM
jgi:predicted enzyme related to lactoylglutathione lyase